MKDTNNENHEDGGHGEEERDDAIIGIALGWSLVVFAVLAVIGGVTAYIVTRPDPPKETLSTELAKVGVRKAPTVELPHVPYTDVTKSAGLTFVHENGARGQKLLPETMGGGCAFFDYDNDGDQDLLLINSKRWDEDKADPNEKPATIKLYQNQGDGSLKDVSEQAGLNVTLYGMGAAVGDYDNDGHVDIFVSALGANQLFHNLGNGKFENVTDAAGVAGGANQWSSSSGWFDYDRDGDLDLFVCNYVVWSRAYDLAQPFRLTGGERAYGRPQVFEGTFPYLYQNQGDGTFSDVSEAAGVQIRNKDTNVPLAKSLGVTFVDFDRDGWLDIVVANDTVQNLLLHNQGNGTFTDVGVLAGVAFDSNGQARGAMGIDAAYFRNDECVGIAIGNFANEMTALYVSQGRQLQFSDEAVSSGLGPNTRLRLTFGLSYLDADLDGRLDLIAANGHLEEDINRVQSSQTYEQPPQLFWNCGPRHATEMAPMKQQQCGSQLFVPMVGRGLSYADIDGDGDLDVLITAVGSAPRLLRNDQTLNNHWLRFKLQGTKCNRDAIGAIVEVKVGGTTMRRIVMPTRSYLSQVELPVTFGIGTATAVDAVTIFWPDGTQQSLDNVAVDKMLTIEQTATAN